MYLEPNDEQGVCGVTVALRNDSGMPQGEAHIRLEWYDREGSRLADETVRMDPLNLAQTDGKNLVLAGHCDRVYKVRVRKADWRLGWDTSRNIVVVIDGVEGQEGVFSWDGKLRLFHAHPGGA